MKRKFPEQVLDLFPHHDNFGDLVGYQVEDFRPGYGKTSLLIQEKHISPAGVCHGGAISTLVDFSMGCALVTQLQKGQLCSTIEFKINYLSPVTLGEKIFCEAKTKFMGRSHAVLDFHVFREAGKDVAAGMGTFNIY
jgi:uncharacterized protein (TIGR00369 family)